MDEKMTTYLTKKPEMPNIIERVKKFFAKITFVEIFHILILFIILSLLVAFLFGTSANEVKREHIITNLKKLQKNLSNDFVQQNSPKLANNVLLDNSLIKNSTLLFNPFGNEIQVRTIISNSDNVRFNIEMNVKNDYKGNVCEVIGNLFPYFREIKVGMNVVSSSNVYECKNLFEAAFHVQKNVKPQSKYTLITFSSENKK